MARLSAGLFVCLAAAAHAEAPAVPVTSLERACELLGGRLQSVGVQNCLHAGLKAGTDASVRGQPILYRDFVPRSLHAPPHRILMLGGIHGDELTSVALVFQWMKQLQQERFQPFHWRVIPCLNPDGLLSNPPVRVNADGVDLNRNFPSRDWNGTAISYWEKKARRDPRRYPGKAALSEPESRALTELIRTFKPEAIISVHAPYDVLDFDGPRHPPKHFGFLNLHQLGT
ncbi:MAG: M14 family zinc carboxypeptidase, partial [Stenotrophobium sp.]